MITGGHSSPKALPLMKTFQEALAICEKQKDGFYLSAFMFQAWIGQLLLDAA